MECRPRAFWGALRRRWRRPDCCCCLVGRDMSFKVVITDCTMPDTGVERGVLSEIGAELVRASCKTSAEMVAVGRDADALMVQWAPISAEVIQHLDRCRIISRYGIGL